MNKSLLQNSATRYHEKIEKNQLIESSDDESDHDIGFTTIIYGKNKNIKIKYNKNYFCF